MKKHTQDYKKQIKEYGRQQSVQISYVENGQEIILTNSEINSATPHYDGDLLKSIMKELDLDSNVNIPVGTKIRFKHGILVNEAYEYIDYGNYYVYSSNLSEDTLSYNIKCYDIMINSMKDYEETGVPYPCTIKEFMSALCIKCNLRMKANMHFANEDRVLTRDLFKDLGYKYRDVFDQLSQVTGGVICATLDDEIEVRYVNKLMNEGTSEKSKVIQFDSEIEESITFDKLYGSHSQRTTEGRNVFNPKITTRTNKGVTVSQEGKYRVKINGKATGAQSLVFDEIPNFEQGKYYTVTIKKISGSCTKVSDAATWGILFFPETVDAGRLTFYPTDTVKSFTFQAIDSNTKPYFWQGWEGTSVVGTNSVFNNLILEISIVEGTTAKEYEDYTGGKPSPSTDCQQEIETMGDNVQLLNNTAVTTTINGVDITVFEDKTVLLNGTATDNVNLVLERNLLLVDGETYTLNSGNRNASSSKFGLYINQYYDKSNHIQASYNSPLKFIYNIKSKDSNNIYIYINKGATVENELLKPKLEKGTKATPYSPYGQGSVEVIKQNKNFLYYEAQNKTIYEVDFTVNNDKSVKVEGTATNTGDFYFVGSGTKYESINLRGAYKISGCNSGSTSKYILYVVKKNEYGALEYYQNVSGDNEINISEGDTFRIFIRVLSGVTVSDTIYPMLRLSTETDDTYVEAKKESYIMPIQQEMLEGDYIDNVEHHEWDKLILTGAEPWYCETNGRFGYLVQNLPKAYKKTIQTSDLLGNVCNSYIEKTPSQTWAGTQGFCIDPAGSLRIWDDTYSKTSDLAGFKAMLAEKYNAGNPVVCYLKLATPIDLALTEEQKKAIAKLNDSKTYIGQNNIYSDSDIQITYPQSYESINEDYLKQDNVQFGEKYGKINSIVLSRSESDNVYIKDDESIEENGLCELKIQENQIMNFNDRSDYLKELAERLFGLEFYINDFTSTGILIYDIMDMYSVIVDEKEYRCLMLNDEVDITQGIEEIIYTEKPESTVTEYSKADKTDRKINQTTLIVDKQAQQIQGVISQIGDRSDKTTTITADIDGLNSKVATIADLTNETSGTQFVALANCVEGEVVELHIYGNNTVFKYQYLSDDLYLSDNLLLGKDKSRIIITDENGNKTYFDLGIEEVLRQRGDTRDEYILKNGQAQIIRRINKDGTIKDNETTEDLGEFHILLPKGNNTLEIKDFSASIYVKWAIQNEYTDIFATKVEMNSSITQTAEEINLEVRKKVGNDEVISKINQSSEEITILANKLGLTANDILDIIAGNSINLSSKNITINSNNFNVDKNGKMTCNNATVKGKIISSEIEGSTIKLGGDADHPEFIADTDDGYRTEIFPLGLINEYDISGTYVALQKGAIGLGLFTDSSMEETASIDYNEIRIPIVSQTSLKENKKNFEKIQYKAIDVIKDIDIYEYNLKHEKNTDKKHIGFVIGNDFNYSKKVTSSDNKGVDSYSFISLCCKAIQELSSKVEELEKKIKEKEEDK